jgi:hypothetical protein
MHWMHHVAPPLADSRNPSGACPRVLCEPEMAIAAPAALATKDLRTLCAPLFLRGGAEHALNVYRVDSLEWAASRGRPSPAAPYTDHVEGG